MIVAGGIKALLAKFLRHRGKGFSTKPNIAVIE
jgi:hypothetical protein